MFFGWLQSLLSFVGGSYFLPLKWGNFLLSEMKGVPLPRGTLIAVGSVFWQCGGVGGVCARARACTRMRLGWGAGLLGEFIWSPGSRHKEVWRVFTVVFPRDIWALLRSLCLASRFHNPDDNTFLETSLPWSTVQLLSYRTWNCSTVLKMLAQESWRPSLSSASDL